jgi:hypothetical protein
MLYARPSLIQFSFSRHFLGSRTNLRCAGFGSFDRSAARGGAAIRLRGRNLGWMRPFLPTVSCPGAPAPYLLALLSLRPSISAADRRQPASGGPKLASGGPKTASGGVQTASGGVKLTSGGIQTTPGGPKTASGGVQTTSGGVKLTSGGIQTTPGGPKLASGGVQTASGGSQTASGGVQTASGGVQTASGGVQTASGRFKLASGGSELVVGRLSVARGGSELAADCFELAPLTPETLLVSEPRAVATGSCESPGSIDPVATALGSDTLSPKHSVVY